jgi:hypothetical protein
MLTETETKTDRHFQKQPINIGFLQLVSAIDKCIVTIGVKRPVHVKK